MKKWTTIGVYCLMTIAALMLALFVVGCGGTSTATETPEHPTAEEAAEHPTEHPKGEAEKGEHPAEGEEKSTEHPTEGEEKPTEHPSEHPE